MNKQKRISAYIDVKDHAALRVRLLRRGVTISQWIRESIKKLLESAD